MTDIRMSVATQEIILATGAPAILAITLAIVVNPAKDQEKGAILAIVLTGAK